MSWIWQQSDSPNRPPGPSIRQQRVERLAHLVISAAQRDLFVDTERPVEVVPHQDPAEKGQVDIAFWAAGEEDARRITEALLDFSDQERRSIYDSASQTLARIRNAVEQMPKTIDHMQRDKEEAGRKLETLRKIVPVTERMSEREAFLNYLSTLEEPLRRAITDSVIHRRGEPAAPGPVQPQQMAQYTQAVEELNRSIDPLKRWETVADYIVELQKQLRTISTEITGVQAELAALDELVKSAAGDARSALMQMRSAREVGLAGAKARRSATELDLKNMTDYFNAHAQQVSLEHAIVGKTNELASAQNALPRHETEIAKYAGWDQPTRVLGAVRINPVKTDK